MTSHTRPVTRILTPLAALLLIAGCDESEEWKPGFERENTVVQVINTSNSDVRLTYEFLGGGVFDEDAEDRSVVVPADTSQDVRMMMKGYSTIAADVRIEVLATGRTLSRRVYRNAPMLFLSNGDLGLAVAN
jgi:hypothetical protein